MVLIGKRGAGKTQMGTCLIGHACAQNRSARYVKSLDIFIELRESFRVEGKSESATIREFVKPSLLVIDAIENRGETDFENRLLNHIIDKRYDNHGDTILISNQTKEEFSATVGPSIISRIHETGSSIECNWKSFRKKQ